jgi:retron-type reverse transcriptase
MSDISFAQVFDYENLYQAYLEARKQKRYRGQVLKFSYSLEENLIQLQNELIWKTYKVGPYRQFKVYEPKERLISALPFRDRIIQHAVFRVIDGVFERRMIYDSYACRKGKGSLAAANRVSYFMGKSGTDKYLKCDVSKYFQSIDVQVMKGILRSYISDQDILWLLDQILDSACGAGIPIGNLLSQTFANTYLNELDFHLKTKLRIPYYVRYMDDFLIFDTSTKRLRALQAEIERFLAEKLHLRLNNKTRVGSTRDGIEFVGFRIFPRNRLIRKSSLVRMSKKYRAWKKNKISDDRFVRSLGSWIGHSKGTASHGFVERMLFNSFQTALKRDESSLNGRV